MKPAPYSGRVKVGGESGVTVRLPAREAAALLGLDDGKVGPWDFRMWAARLVNRKVFESSYWNPKTAQVLYVEALQELLERNLVVRSDGRLFLTEAGKSVVAGLRKLFPAGRMSVDEFLKLCRSVGTKKTGRFAL